MTHVGDIKLSAASATSASCSTAHVASTTVASLKATAHAAAKIAAHRGTHKARLGLSILRATVRNGVCDTRQPYLSDVD